MVAHVMRMVMVSKVPFVSASSHTLLELESKELSVLISSFDIKRLESYANNMLDYHVILDLLPTLSNLYFKRRLIAPKVEPGPSADGSARERTVKLSSLQRAMLLAMGLQRKTIEEAGEELALQPNQVLAEFAKIIKKTCAVLQLIQRAAVVGDMPQIGTLSMDDTAHNAGALERMDEELEEAAKEVRRELRAQADEEMVDADTDGVVSQKKARQREFIDSLDLSQ